METTFWQVLCHHWKPLSAILVVLWLLSNIVSTMPAPTQNGGPRGKWWYAWLFGFSHGAFGMLPRVFAVLLPSLIYRVSPLLASLLGIHPQDIVLLPVAQEGEHRAENAAAAGSGSGH